MFVSKMNEQPQLWENYGLIEKGSCLFP